MLAHLFFLILSPARGCCKLCCFAAGAQAASTCRPLDPFSWPLIRKRRQKSAATSPPDHPSPGYGFHLELMVMWVMWQPYSKINNTHTPTDGLWDFYSESHRVPSCQAFYKKHMDGGYDSKLNNGRKVTAIFYVPWSTWWVTPSGGSWGFWCREHVCKNCLVVEYMITLFDDVGFSLPFWWFARFTVFLS